jgi:hypothetical protein
MANAAQGVTAYRIVSESGTVFATVYDASEAATAREYYADRYACIVTVKRIPLTKDPRW